MHRVFHALYMRNCSSLFVDSTAVNYRLSKINYKSHINTCCALGVIFGHAQGGEITELTELKQGNTQPSCFSLTLYIVQCEDLDGSCCMLLVLKQTNFVLCCQTTKGKRK